VGLGESPIKSQSVLDAQYTSAEISDSLCVLSINCSRCTYLADPAMQLMGVALWDESSAGIQVHNVRLQLLRMWILKDGGYRAV